MPELDKNCTLLINAEKGVQPNTSDIQKRLESNKDTVKAEALEELILAMMQGDNYSKLLMTVIRFVVTSTNHRIKKLLMIYWEIVDKCKTGGELKEEMILVCNALLNDLTSANEYVRGSTLRLLCKMRYYKIIEPLIEAILKNVTHRHSYVRRNAVMCVYSVIKSFGTDVIPHAAEEVEQLLLVEGDLSTKRNSFLMLLHCDQDRAINYVLSVQDVVSSLGDIFQLVLLELLRKVCRQHPEQKGELLRIIINLVQSASPAVAYEGAASLVALSSSNQAVKAATQSYVNLLVDQSDNNVKLIVLDRLSDIMKKHKHVLAEFVMDILRALSCPSLDVRRKTMQIGLRLVSPRNVVEVVGLLKKEIMKTTEPEEQTVAGNLEYRQLLIRSVHSACTRFPDVAQTVIHLLLDFLGESDQTTTTEVAMFVRELVATYSSFRPSVMQRVIESLQEIQQSRVIRVSLWILGEYAADLEMVEACLNAILEAVSTLPLLTTDKDMNRKSRRFANEVEDFTATKSEAPKLKCITRTVVLPDGTYGTESVYETVNEGAETTAIYNVGEVVQQTILRNFIIGGDFLLCSMVAVTLTKLALKEEAGLSLSASLKNRVFYCTACLLKFVRDQPTGGALCDASIRISQCLRAQQTILMNDVEKMKSRRRDWFPDSRNELSEVLEIEAENNETAMQLEETVGRTVSEPDALIVFRQLRERRGGWANDMLDDDDADVQTALGSCPSLKDDSTLFQQRLAKVQQMTGIADPLYVEAFLQVHQFDLVLELLVINRTNETLQNLHVELSTNGDLKLVDRPAAVTLATAKQVTLYASIKVQSTENGIIFGYVTYDKRSALDKECLVLNEMHIDLLDYIQRSWIGELAFRTMWSEFEWENKINVATSITDVGAFLEHIMRNTNMTVVGKYAKPPIEIVVSKSAPTCSEGILCPTAKGTNEKDEYLQSVKDMSPLKKLTANSSFFAVNLYSKSIFGEDALANLSIEKLPDGKLAGSVRIRSRTQGIALSLGDRITTVQRGLNLDGCC